MRSNGGVGSGSTWENIAGRWVCLVAVARHALTLSSTSFVPATFGKEKNELMPTPRPVALAFPPWFAVSPWNLSWPTIEAMVPKGGGSALHAFERSIDTTVTQREGPR